ncbi:clathrin assembly protein [Canna indica]|uniref:Clathrin assembly protein n=1 Tax=Canna indica TaxID=4628 RepID=A0AAQ3Q331_9LILI|nr:clathrin assembly protein [Canna indica]
MTSAKQWWRRATATAKDKWSICVTRTLGGRHLHRRSAEVEAAVIRATSHDDRSVDYKSAGRVFAWARAAPSSLLVPLMWSVSRRASRTRSWPVALKCLLLAHGLLLCSDEAPPSARVGRIPFDLSDFRDRSSAAPGFSAFVRAYFRFLDRRSIYSALRGSCSPEAGENIDADLDRLERLQVLLELMMQIRPYADGMEVGLILEAMDCVVIEIFEVYSTICHGIAHFLVSAAGPDPARPDAASETTRRRRIIGLGILRRAAVQSAQLSAYFDLCRALGVVNAAELPPVEGIPEKDMEDLEAMMLGKFPESCREEEQEQEQETKKTTMIEGHTGTLITSEWVCFEDENDFGNAQWALAMQPMIATGPQYPIGDLIDLS